MIVGTDFAGIPIDENGNRVYQSATGFNAGLGTNVSNQPYGLGVYEPQGGNAYMVTPNAPLTNYDVNQLQGWPGNPGSTGNYPDYETDYAKGGNTGGLVYQTDGSYVPRSQQQTYGNNEYGYGGGYDPNAYNFGGTNYSTGNPQNATTAIQNAQYMSGGSGGGFTTDEFGVTRPISGNITVQPYNQSSYGGGGYATGVQPQAGYSIQPGTAAAQYGGGMTLGDTQMAGQVYNDSQAYAQQYADMYQNQLNNQMYTQQVQGQNQFNQNMMNTGTSTYAGGGDLFSQYQPY
jgi:hypothetical protein